MREAHSIASQRKPFVPRNRFAAKRRDFVTVCLQTVTIFMANILFSPAKGYLVLSMLIFCNSLQHIWAFLLQMRNIARVAIDMEHYARENAAKTDFSVTD